LKISLDKLLGACYTGFSARRLRCRAAQMPHGNFWMLPCGILIFKFYSAYFHQKPIALFLFPLQTALILQLDPVSFLFVIV